MHGGRDRMPVSIVSKPSAHSLFVALPLLAEIPLQLFFFPANESIHERNMKSGRDERRWRTEEQRRTEKNEHASAEIERVSGETIGAGGDERALRLERDHPHSARIEVERSPYAY